MRSEVSHVVVVLITALGPLTLTSDHYGNGPCKR